MESAPDRNWPFIMGGAVLASLVAVGSGLAGRAIVESLWAPAFDGEDTPLSAALEGGPASTSREAAPEEEDAATPVVGRAAIETASPAPAPDGIATSQRRMLIDRMVAAGVSRDVAEQTADEMGFVDGVDAPALASREDPSARLTSTAAKVTATSAATPNAGRATPQAGAATKEPRTAADRDRQKAWAAFVDKTPALFDQAFYEAFKAEVEAGNSWDDANKIVVARRAGKAASARPSTTTDADASGLPSVRLEGIAAAKGGISRNDYASNTAYLSAVRFANAAETAKRDVTSGIDRQSGARGYADAVRYAGAEEDYAAAWVANAAEDARLKAEKAERELVSRAADRSSTPTGGEQTQAAQHASAGKDGNATSLVKRGWQAISSGNYSIARDLFERATVLEPGNAEPWFGLGYSEEKLGRSEAARYYYCQTVDVADPTSETVSEALLRLKVNGTTCG
jgi:hypothetical protein